jgi:leucyl aminopeptidase
MTNLKVDFEFKNIKNFSSLDTQNGQALFLGLHNADKKLQFCNKVRGFPELNSLLSTLNPTVFDAKFLSSLPLLFRQNDKALPHPNIALIGLGEKKHYTPQNALKLGATLGEVARKYKFKFVDLYLDSFILAPNSNTSPDAAKDFAGRPQLAGLMKTPEFFEKLILGWLLGSYSFKKYKSANPTKNSSENEAPIKVRLFSKLIDGLAMKKIVERARTLSEGVFITRDLQTLPSNDLYPSLLAQEAQKTAKLAGINITVFDEKKLVHEKMIPS